MSLAKNLIAAFLAWSARRQLASQPSVVVGVTGTTGKTSTKEAIGFVLRRLLRSRLVIVAPGNLNTELGLPLAILELDKPTSHLGWVGVTLVALWRGLMPRRFAASPVYVLEYAITHPGDMRVLVRIARPTIAVVTTIGAGHLATLGSRERVAREKGQLVRALPSSGLAVLNASDQRVLAMHELTEASVRLVNSAGQNLSLALAEAMAVYGFDLRRAEVRRVLGAWQPPLGRLRLHRGIKGSWLLDDTYNANPDSATYALAELQRLGTVKQATRRIAVLGDMLELGAEENKAHQGIALLADRVADVVVLVGPRFRRTKGSRRWFPGPVQAAAELAELVRAGDLILVKGSEGMRMEKVSEVLLDKRLSPATHLVRQRPDWKRKPYVAP